MTDSIFHYTRLPYHKPWTLEKVTRKKVYKMCFNLVAVVEARRCIVITFLAASSRVLLDCAVPILSCSLVLLFCCCFVLQLCSCEPCWGPVLVDPFPCQAPPPQSPQLVSHFITSAHTQRYNSLLLAVAAYYTIQYLTQGFPSCVCYAF